MKKRYYALKIEGSNLDRENTTAGIVEYDPNKSLESFAKTISLMIKEDLDADVVGMSPAQLEGIGGFPGMEIDFEPDVWINDDPFSVDIHCTLTEVPLYGHDDQDELESHDEIMSR